MEYAYDYFVSYAHKDDEPQEGAEAGFVSEFVRKIAENEEFYKLFNAKPRVFFDKSTLNGMDDWNAKIFQGISKARFFIAMVSPNYFESEFCKHEFDWWVSREAQRQLVGEAAAPMQIVKIPGLFPDKNNPNAKLQPGFYGAHRRQIDNFKRCQFAEEFDLDKLNYAKIDETLHALKKLCVDRVYRQNAAGRSPLSSKYPRHNENFVGRRENLDKLRKDLATAQVAAISAVNGLGGIGKTALALTYGHAFAWDYELGRAFVPCEGKTSLRAAILSANLVNLVGLDRFEGNEEEQYNQFWRLLEEKRAEIVKKNKAAGREPDLGAFLYLILDNVTSPKLVSNKELAQLPKFVHAVVTTRKPLEFFAHIEGQTLDALSEEEALELLDNLRQFKADTDDREAALEIVKLLGGFAFAVEIVGSYLRQKKFATYRKYADRLRADLLKVLDETTLTRGLQLRDHPIVLVKNVLAPTLAALSKNARNLLKVASLFSPDAIPIPWLGGFLYLDVDDVNEGLFELENFGLLTPLDATQKGEIWNGTLARLHRLAREQIRAKLPPKLGDSVECGMRTKSVKMLEWDVKVFFQPDADWRLTAFFEFYLELASDRKDSSQNEIVWNLSWKLATLGRLFQRLGRTTQARIAFSEGIAICKCLVEGLLDKSAVRRELSAFYDSLGDLELAEGNAAKARKYYQESLAISRRFAESLPNDVQAQRDLSVSYVKLGNLELAEGNAARAREYYEESLAISYCLVKILPNDVRVQRDLSVSFNKLGDLELAEGNAEQAREYYQKSLAIRRRLAKALPNDVQAQRGLNVSFERSGDLELAEGNVAKAREYYQDSLAIRRYLAEVLPNDVQAQRDLSCVYIRTGALELAEGNVVKAREYYQDSLEIFRHLAKTLPNDVQAQRDLLCSYGRFGLLLKAEKDFVTARDCFRQALELATRNFELASGFVQFRQDLAAVYRELGDVEKELGNVEASVAYLLKFMELSEGE